MVKKTKKDQNFSISLSVEPSESASSQLDSFLIQNFKPYKTKQEIKFAPLTFLYGPNSAGKTSLIQSILMTAQTQQSVKDNTSANTDLILQGEYFEAGNYESLAHNKNIKDDLVVGWTCTLAKNEILRGIELHYRYNKNQSVVKLNKVLPKVWFKDELTTIPFTNKNSAINSNLKKDINEAFNPLSIWTIEKDTTRGKKALKILKEFSEFVLNQNKQHLTLKKKIDDLENKLGIVKPEQFEISEDQNKEDIKILLSLHKEDIKESEEKASIQDPEGYEILKRLKGEAEFTEKALDKIIDNYFFIQERNGFLPTAPPSIGTYTTIMQRSKGGPIINPASMVLLSVLNTINFNILGDGSFKNAFSNFGYIGPLRSPPQASYKVEDTQQRNVGKGGEHWVNNVINQPDVKEDLIKWCKELTGYSLELNNVKTTHESRAEVLLRKPNSTKVSIDNVGFGIGQLLPIIAEGLLKKRGSIVVEQPEIHVHPKLQAELVEFLTKTAKTGRNKQGNRWLIETHSHLMALRVQKKIRNGSLKKEDVAFYYCDPSNQGTEIKELRLDDEGNWLDAWPSGFFEEAYNEKFK